MYTVQVVRIPSLLFCSMDVFLGFETMLGKFLNERTFLFPTHTNSIISSRIAWLGCWPSRMNVVGFRANGDEIAPEEGRRAPVKWDADELGGKA